MKELIIEPFNSLELQIASCCSRDEGISLLGLVLPGRMQLLGRSVVASESVDSAFDENESELAVLVLSVSLQVLSNVDSLLDQVVEIFGNLGGESVLLQDSEDLVSSDTLDLGDAVVVSKDDTDLRGRGALLGELNNLFNQFVSGDLNPAGGSTSGGEASASNTLTIGVHSTHLSSI